MGDAHRRKTVGKWVLSSQLGRGSFAVVWKGQNCETGATVAVKEIITSQLNAKLKQSLECEISILKKVVHRNIVRLQETLEVRLRLLARSPVVQSLRKDALRACLGVGGAWHAATECEVWAPSHRVSRIQWPGV